MPTRASSTPPSKKPHSNRAWEIAYETTPGAYALGSGAASFSGGTAGSSGALGLAANWLAGLSDGAGRPIGVLESSDHQDAIFAPVPEPSTYMLMLAGLVAGAEISQKAKAGLIFARAAGLGRVLHGFPRTPIMPRTG